MARISRLGSLGRRLPAVLDQVDIRRGLLPEYFRAPEIQLGVEVSDQNTLQGTPTLISRPFDLSSQVTRSCAVAKKCACGRGAVSRRQWREQGIIARCQEAWLVVGGAMWQAMNVS